MPDRIIINSTGCGNYSNKTAGSSFFIQVKNSLYQFEADEGISSVINKSKLDINSIRSIFISHLHPDHIVGLFVELQSMHLAERIEALELYVPGEGITQLESFLDMLYLFKEKMQFKLVVKPIDVGLFFDDDDLSVTAIGNSHLNKNARLIDENDRSNKCQSYSFKIECGDKRVYYSGDIASIDELTGKLDNIDIVISELSHVEPLEVIDLCVERGVEKLIFIHFMEDITFDPDTVLGNSRKRDSIDIHLAHEGMVISI